MGRVFGCALFIFDTSYLTLFMADYVCYDYLTKGDMLMTDKDRDQYMDVLFALAGFGNINVEKEKEDEKVVSEFVSQDRKGLILRWFKR